MSLPSRRLHPGVSIATVTIFEGIDQGLDLLSTRAHILRLARSGANSITVAGSNGEGPHLVHEERATLIRAIRDELDGNDFDHLPIISNCSAQSVREVTILCEQAHKAGADFALILPPCYFKGSYSRRNIIGFYTEAATKSAIPIIIYNYPPVVAGTNIDSDMIIELAAHPNITGCKFTCADMGKITRVVNAVGAGIAQSSWSGFYASAGLADCMVATIAAGGTGVTVGLGNVLPKSCVKLFNLCVAGGESKEISELQRVLAEADGILVAGGITSVKSVMQSFYGYGGIPRRPLPAAEVDDSKMWAASLKQAIDYENSL